MQTMIKELMFFILVFGIAANMAVQVMDTTLHIIFAPWYGGKVSSVSFFGLFFIKQNGKWEVSFRRLSYLCQCSIIRDKSKPIPENSDKSEKLAMHLIYILGFLISLSIAFMFSDYFLNMFHGKLFSLSDKFIVFFVGGMVIQSIVNLGTCVYTYQVVMKRLGGYINVIIKKLRQGYSFEELNLKPLEDLPYKKVSQNMKLLYYNFYVYYLMATDKVGEMQKISHEITYLLKKQEFFSQITSLYYWLIYYYSKYEMNYQLADEFKEKAWPVLSKDEDANAKRVLAYYYKIQGDIKNARKYLNEGLACVESFSSGGERELERKILRELEEELKERNVL